MIELIPSKEPLLYRKICWRRLRALIRKESFQILRDPSTLLITVVLPLILLFLYGFGVSLDLNNLRIGLVMEETAPDAQSFAETLQNSRYFDVTVVRDRRLLTEAVENGSIRGFFVIPSYFSKNRLHPDLVAPIQVIADGSEPNTANFIQYYAQGAFTTWLTQQALNRQVTNLPLLSAQPRFWYNEQLESRFFLLPGSLAMIMTLIGTLLTSLVVSREWERGTMEAVLSTTVSVWEIVAGKVIPYFFLGMVSMAICVTVSVWGYGLPLRGSLLLLFGISACFLCCALAIGLMISTLARNQTLASQIAIVLGFLPAYTLSGFLFEISSMPLPIQWLTFLIPARYFVQALQTLFLVGNVWSLLLWDLAMILLVGGLVFFITARKTVHRLD